MIHETARKKIEGKQPGERVSLALWLSEPQLPDAEAKMLLNEYKGLKLVQTTFLATVNVMVEHVEAVANLPSVREVR